MRRDANIPGRSREACSCRSAGPDGFLNCHAASPLWHFPDALARAGSEHDERVPVANDELRTQRRSCRPNPVGCCVGICDNRRVSSDTESAIRDWTVRRVVSLRYKLLTTDQDPQICLATPGEHGRWPLSAGDAGYGGPKPTTWCLPPGNLRKRSTGIKGRVRQQVPET